MRSPLYTLHTPILQSQDPDAKYSPLGEKATLFTQPECPVRAFICSPVDIFHILIVQSQDPDAK